MIGMWPEAWLRLHERERLDRALPHRAPARIARPVAVVAATPTPSPVAVGSSTLACC